MQNRGLRAGTLLGYHSGLTRKRSEHDPMSQHPFLKIATRSSKASFQASDLPDSSTLNSLFRRLCQTGESMRLVDQKPEELNKYGNASTPEEVMLNQRYMQLAQRFPLIADKLKLPKTLVQDAFQAEQALGQVRNMYRQIRLGARAGTILLAADLTEKLDRVEGAAVRLLAPDAQDTPDKARLRALASGPEGLRATLMNRSEARQRRVALRAQQGHEAVAQAQAAQEALQQEEALRDAVATTLPTPPTRKATSKRLAKKNS